MAKPRRCTRCKRLVEKTYKVGSIRLCAKCSGREDQEINRIRGDEFLPPELRAMAKDMGLEKELEKMEGGP